eukprot:271284_1
MTLSLCYVYFYCIFLIFNARSHRGECSIIMETKVDEEKYNTNPTDIEMQEHKTEIQENEIDMQENEINQFDMHDIEIDYTLIFNNISKTFEDPTTKKKIIITLFVTKDKLTLKWNFPNEKENTCTKTWVCNQKIYLTKGILHDIFWVDNNSLQGLLRPELHELLCKKLGYNYKFFNDNDPKHQENKLKIKNSIEKIKANEIIKSIYDYILLDDFLVYSFFEKSYRFILDTKDKPPEPILRKYNRGEGFFHQRNIENKNQDNCDKPINFPPMPATALQYPMPPLAVESFPWNVYQYLHQLISLIWDHMKNMFLHSNKKAFEVYLCDILAFYEEPDEIKNWNPIYQQIVLFNEKVIPFIPCSFFEFMTTFMMRLKEYWVLKTREIVIDSIYDFSKYNKSSISDDQIWGFAGSSVCKNIHGYCARNVSVHQKMIYIPMFKHMLTTDLNDKRIPERLMEVRQSRGYCVMDPKYRNVTGKALLDFKLIVFKSLDVSKTKKTFNAEIKNIVNKYRKEFCNTYDYKDSKVSEEEMNKRKDIVCTKYMTILLSQAEYAIIKAKGYTKPFQTTRERQKFHHLNSGKHTNPKVRK